MYLSWKRKEREYLRKNFVVGVYKHLILVVNLTERTNQQLQIHNLSDSFLPDK